MKIPVSMSYNHDFDSMFIHKELSETYNSLSGFLLDPPTR